MDTIFGLLANFGLFSTSIYKQFFGPFSLGHSWPFWATLDLLCAILFLLPPKMAASSAAAKIAVESAEAIADEKMAEIFADPAMEAAVRKGKMTLKSVLTEFAEWTAIPGPIQLVYALNTFTRVLWLLIWLVAFGIFAYEAYLIQHSYLQYVAEIKDSLQFQAKRFPVFTFCNQNPYKLSLVQANPSFSPIRTLMDDFLITFQNGGNANISRDNFGINKASTRFQKERFARRALMLLASQLPESTRRQAVYSFEEMVGFCFFNNVPCGKANFSSFLDPIYGACFQFNFPNQSDFYTFRPGKNAGLRLLLRILQTDPITGAQLYLPTTMSAGVRIAVEMGNVFPALDDTGLSIGVGREEMVTMENTKTNLQKEPYGICRDGTEAGVLNYYPNFTYTLQSCLRSCRQNRVIQKCGCADPRFGKPQNASICTIANVFCLLQLDSEAQSTEQFSPIRDCGCRPACHSQRVDLLNAQGRFPSPNFLPVSGLHSQFNLACQGPAFAGNLACCIKWHRENALVLSVWFDGMDYIQHDQQAVYTLVRASNDLGGQMGLWLGVCLISIFEVLTLFLMIFLYFTRGRKVRVVPSQTEKMRDSRYKNIQELKLELDIHERIDDRIKKKIERQRRERYQKMLQAEADLARARQTVAQTRDRAEEMAELAAQNPDDTKINADAANAAALAHGARLRAKKLEELVSIYSI